MAYCGGLVVTFLLAVTVARIAFPNRLAALGLGGLAAIFANTGYMGIPLLQIAFGEAALFPGIIATVLNGAVVMAFGTILIEIDLGRGAKKSRLLLNVLKSVLRSPLVLSAAAGLAVSALRIEVPIFIGTFCDLLGASVGPCALFAMGLFMTGRSFTAGALEVSWLTLLKLLVQPLITWWLAFHVLSMNPIWATSAVILAALPTGALVFVLAQRYGIYVQRATAVIMVSTVISLATLSVLLVFLGVS